jgi:transposase
MGRPKANDLGELAAKAMVDLGNIKDLRVRKRLEAVKAIANYSLTTVAEVHNVSRAILDKWAARYRNGGVDALYDRRRTPRSKK